MTTYASPANTYQWNDANGPISGATSSTYGATSTGTYSLTVTTPAGCVVTSEWFYCNTYFCSTKRTNRFIFF